MLIRKPNGIRPSEITPETRYLNRRELIGGTLGALAAAALPAADTAEATLEYTLNSRYVLPDKVSTLEEITHYNNFYEFGTRKTDPADNAGTLRPHPWSVTIAGEANITGNFTLEDILKPHALEERIYRLRCVEAWSMVVPWLGFSLANLLTRFKPTSKAKYVEFTVE